MRFRQFFTGHISLSLMRHAGDDRWIVKMFIINMLRKKWAKVLFAYAVSEGVDILKSHSKKFWNDIT